MKPSNTVKEERLETSKTGEGSVEAKSDKALKVVEAAFRSKTD